MLNKKLLGAMLTGAVLLGQYAGAAHAQARVYFIEPKDGATVTSPVHMKFGVDGMTVAPAGTMTPGTGHHHLLIDSKALPEGTVIPANDTSLHFGKGQTEADVPLSPGDHTLTLQFGDGAHRSYGPDMAQTIKVHVQ